MNRLDRFWIFFGVLFFLSNAVRSARYGVDGEVGWSVAHARAGHRLGACVRVRLGPSQGRRVNRAESVALVVKHPGIEELGAHVFVIWSAKPDHPEFKKVDSAVWEVVKLSAYYAAKEAADEAAS